jgi:SAM-dependent methyltransferase
MGSEDESAPASGGAPNAETIGVWNDVLASRFIRFRPVFVGGSAPHSAEALARHPLGPGERVLDVGCGFGETTIEMARAVGPAGRALGVDVAEPFLAIARADAARAGVANAAFRSGDAQVARFDASDGAPFDVCFSRFGSMFFADPTAAFANLRGAMRPGGRLLMVVWRRIEDNAWAATAREVARKHLPPPPAYEAPATAGPGPFSMAEPDAVRALLLAAGWTEPALEPVDKDFDLGATVEDAVAYLTTLGPAGAALRDAGPRADEARPAIAAELAERFRPFAGPRGVVMRAASWCVTAGA